jgi:hypothetical protein
MKVGIEKMVRKMSRLTAHASNLGKAFLAKMYEDDVIQYHNAATNLGADDHMQLDPTIVDVTHTTLWKWILKASTHEGLKNTKKGSLSGKEYEETLKKLAKEVRMDEGVGCDAMIPTIIIIIMMMVSSPPPICSHFFPLPTAVWRRAGENGL